jgi:hypothetical protein
MTKLIISTIPAVIVFLSMAPPELRPVTPLPHIIEHAGIFALAGINFALGYPGRERLLSTGAILFCAGIELVQLAIPGRHARLSDFLVDAAAALVGVLLGSITARRFPFNGWLEKIDGRWKGIPWRILNRLAIARDEGAANHQIAGCCEASGN